jgi:hypothetical protein
MKASAGARSDKAKVNHHEESIIIDESIEVTM